MKNRDHEAQIQATFDSVAEVYDHPVMSWFDRTAGAIASTLSLDAGAKVLDLATGTGKVAIAIAQANPEVDVLGIDLSSGMLAQATAKGKQLGLRNLRFEQGSFSELDNSADFSAVTCSFGLFFVDSMSETLRNFGAQLVPDGCVVLSSFAAGAFSPFSDEFLRLYAEFGGEVQPPRWLRLSSSELVSAVFQEAGLALPEVERHDFGFDLESAESWWEIVSSAGYRGMLNTLDAEQQALFKTKHIAEVTKILASGQRHLNVEVLISRAVARDRVTQ